MLHQLCRYTKIVSWKFLNRRRYSKVIHLIIKDLFLLTETPFSKRVFLGFSSATKGPQALLENLMNGLLINGLSIKQVKTLNAKYKNESKMSFEVRYLLVPKWLSSPEVFLELIKTIKPRFVILGPNFLFDESILLSLIKIMSNQKIIGIVHTRLNQVLQDPVLNQIKWIEWDSGIDTCYWRPSLLQQRNRLVIYIKGNLSNEDQAMANSILNRYKKRVLVIHYGQYDIRSWRRILRSAIVVIWFGVAESQGIALSESWSTNTPTLVRIPKHLPNGKDFARLMTPLCGNFFDNEHELLVKVQSLINGDSNYKPRRWIKDNLRHERKSLELLEQISHLISGTE